LAIAEIGEIAEISKNGENGGSCRTLAIAEIGEIGGSCRTLAIFYEYNNGDNGVLAFILSHY
jgi:hypothetical protein